MITDHFRKLKIAPSVIIQNLIKIELLIACVNMVDKDHLLTIATHIPLHVKRNCNVKDWIFVSPAIYLKENPIKCIHLIVTLKSMTSFALNDCI